MSKSFKKVIACVLAVLMVMFSVPFTALAAPGDYAPDISLRFGTMHGGPAKNIQSWVDQTLTSTGANQATSSTGVFDVPVHLENGNLVLKASEMQATIANNASKKYAGGTAFSAQDYTYQVGDVFTVTVMVKNVDKMYILEDYISYSDNIEPAGIVQYTDWDYETQYKFATASEMADMESAFDDYNTDEDDAEWASITAGLPIDKQSISNLKDGDGNQYMNYADGKADDGSKAENGVMTILCVPLFPADETYINVGSYSGAIMGDDMVVGTNKAPKTIDGCYLETFAFKITGSGPISFEQETPDNIDRGYFIGDMDDSTAPETYTTYAINTYGVDGATSSSDENIPEAQRNPGSTKMTFMGTNVNNASAPVAHTHDFTGAEVAWAWADDNTSATATITCTADGCDQSEGYQLSATDNEIASTVKTAGTCTTKAVNTLTAEVTLNGTNVSTSKDVEGAIDANNHDYIGVHTDATCTSNGYTTYTCSRCADSYVEFDNPDTTLAHNYNTPVGIAWDGDDAVTATVTLKCATCDATTTTAASVNSVEKSAATCEANQVMTYTASYNGIDSISKDVEVANSASGHAWAPASVDWNSLDTATAKVDVNYVCGNDANHTKKENVTATTSIKQAQTEDDAEITTFTVSVDGLTDSKDVQTKAPAGHTTHNFNVPVSLAWDSEDAVTATATFKCAKCDETTSFVATVNSVEKSAATCEANQVITYTASYDGFNSISKDVEVANTASGHEFVAQNIVWDGEDATTATVNFVCANDANHTKTEKANIEKNLKAAATKTTPAVYTYVASYGDLSPITKDVQEGEALGVTITVPKYETGEFTINGEVVDGTKVSEINVPYGSSVKFAVTDGADYFKGWSLNGKIASKDANYTYEAATFDMTVAPEFVIPNDSTMTVVFFDKFGNTVREYKDIDKAEYLTKIAADGIPTATSFPSSKFIGWDMTDDDILALQTSATIMANYEDVESETKYTVTVLDANNADITDTALNTNGAVNGAIPYDTKVTVSDDNAAGWAINGTTVSTEKSYSFFVGADVTIQMLAVAEETPTTAIIGHTQLASPDYKYNIMATRFVPEGWTLVDYGFVYGKNLTDAELDLDKEGEQGANNGAGAVKVAHGSMSNSSSEFALNYGIKAKNAPITAKSFVVAKKGADIKVIYSELYTINY